MLSFVANAGKKMLCAVRLLFAKRFLVRWALRAVCFKSIALWSSAPRQNADPVHQHFSSCEFRFLVHLQATFAFSGDTVVLQWSLQVQGFSSWTTPESAHFLPYATARQPILCDLLTRIASNMDAGNFRVFSAKSSATIVEVPAIVTNPGVHPVGLNRSPGCGRKTAINYMRARQAHTCIKFFSLVQMKLLRGC